jgi:hypothetical protein
MYRRLDSLNIQSSQPELGLSASVSDIMRLPPITRCCCNFSSYEIKSESYNVRKSRGGRNYQERVHQTGTPRWSIRILVNDGHDNINCHRLYSLLNFDGSKLSVLLTISKLLKANHAVWTNAAMGSSVPHLTNVVLQFQ